jgi:hypothetical protein
MGVVKVYNALLVRYLSRERERERDLIFAVRQHTVSATTFIAFGGRPYIFVVIAVVIIIFVGVLVLVLVIFSFLVHTGHPSALPSPSWLGILYTSLSRFQSMFSSFTFVLHTFSPASSSLPTPNPNPALHPHPHSDSYSYSHPAAAPASSAPATPRPNTAPLPSRRIASSPPESRAAVSISASYSPLCAPSVASRRPGPGSGLVAVGRGIEGSAASVARVLAPRRV